MSVFRDAAYWAKRVLMGLYGPAELDEKHDPVEQLKREHERDVQAEEAANERQAQPPPVQAGQLPEERDARNEPA